MTGESTFKGRYLHWDNYFSGTGLTLLRILKENFRGDVKQMLKVLIDDHKAGWSTVNGDWSKPINSEGGPVCFCHGPNKETDDQVVTEKDDCGAEWAYVFDEELNLMHVCRMMVRDKTGKENTVTGMFGYGVKGQYWEDVATIDLSKDEPIDVTEIECGKNFERCNHYASKHIPALEGSTLGMRTYLGLRPLDFHDAIAFLIGGKRYKATGSGGNGDFLRRTGKNFPSGTWVATVVAGNGRRLDVPVARRTTNDGYAPLPGVAWVYPPTKNNPQETLVSV